MDKAAIYYFSGTGNSLVVARDIAGRINGKLIPVSSVIDNETIKPDGDIIGVVFPVYNQGIPFIIKRLVDKMDNLDKKYIFAICTCGGSPCLSLEYLGKLIMAKKGELSVGFSVKMPYNYISPTFVLKDFLKSFTLRETSLEKQQEMVRDWERKVEIVSQFINARKKGKCETSARLIEHSIDLFNLREVLQKAVWLKVAGFEEPTGLTFQESIQLMDHGFKCDDKCIGCNTCSRVCSVKNIKMVDGRPVWQHRCEQCFACLQWCPKEAIQFGSKTSGQKRYHHPDVKLSDMLLG
ncbi:MAG: EFR1 family ferrodoxin [Pseudomonadota bacterium]